MSDEEKAYIAGFLDGDGSIYLSLKPRKTVLYGFRPKTVICFYQDSDNENGLQWIQYKLGTGYFSRRNDGMTELRYEGYAKVKSILTQLLPYLIFKHERVKLMLQAIEILEHNPSTEEFLRMCEISDKISHSNYRTTKKKHNAFSVRQELIRKGLLSP